MLDQYSFIRREDAATWVYPMSAYADMGDGWLCFIGV